MTTYQLEFGKVGDSYPVPPLTLQTSDPDEFAKAVAQHAIPHLRPALEVAGRPELADCVFVADLAHGHGHFLWLDLVTGEGARFCGARITAV